MEKIGTSPEKIKSQSSSKDFPFMMELYVRVDAQQFSPNPILMFLNVALALLTKSWIEKAESTKRKNLWKAFWDA